MQAKALEKREVAEFKSPNQLEDKLNLKKIKIKQLKNEVQRLNK